MNIKCKQTIFIIEFLCDKTFINFSITQTEIHLCNFNKITPEHAYADVL